MTLRAIALTCTLFAAMLSLSAQQYPRPNAAQQAGIDKDNSRHFGDSPADPGPLATDLSPALTPAAIDHATRKVADWELARAQPTWDQIWTSSVLYAGFMATSSQLNDPKYSNAMLGMANQFHWQLRGRQPNQDENVAHLPGADDQALAQTYLELYLLSGKKDPSTIALLRADFDAVLPLQTLRANDPRIPWWWCDALFMAPPAWARLYAITGDHKYIDYLNLNWQRTSDLLYDKQDHLYARDATYIGKLGPNGKKIYWSRGEGWVLGGLARTLEYLPKDDPRRPFYVQQMRDMAASLAALQETSGDAAGLWHSSLLDPKDFPLPENSGSALILFGMTYGVNEGILDRAAYLPIIKRAWTGLLRHVYADGRLGDIQQTGAEPTPYYPGSSYDYGIGGYLLAASELKRMAAASTSQVHPRHTTH
jgi:unsaturated rhamnogalacturonyl hydrolase